MLNNLRNREHLSYAITRIALATASFMFIIGIPISDVSGIQLKGLIPASSASNTTSPSALPGSATFLKVITKVDNINGGTKKPSDFTATTHRLNR